MSVKRERRLPSSSTRHAFLPGHLSHLHEVVALLHLLVRLVQNGQSHVRSCPGKKLAGDARTQEITWRAMLALLRDPPNGMEYRPHKLVQNVRHRVIQGNAVHGVTERSQTSERK